jgi:hypothetical protein
MPKTATRRRPTTTSAQRARRFPIHAAVRYRADNGPWRSGTSENISRSGLLLHAAEPLTTNASVEVVIDLPPAGEGQPPATLLCRGRVSRRVELVDPVDLAAIPDIVVALSITSCRIGRVDDLPAEPHDA